MKKIAFVCFLAALFTFSFHTAEAQTYEKGSKVLNVGLGIGGWYGGFITPGVSASFEVGAFETGTFGVIGIGGYTGFRVAKDDLFIGGDVSYTHFVVAPRATYHFVIIPVENLDVYAAAQVILAFETINYDDDFFDDTNSLIVYPGVVAGVRYYFSDSMAVFGELGYNLNYLTAGIAFDF